MRHEALKSTAVWNPDHRCVTENAETIYHRGISKPGKCTGSLQSGGGGGCGDCGPGAGGLVLGAAGGLIMGLGARAQGVDIRGSRGVNNGAPKKPTSSSG